METKLLVEAKLSPTPKPSVRMTVDAKPSSVPGWACPLSELLMEAKLPPTPKPSVRTAEGAKLSPALGWACPSSPP